MSNKKDQIESVKQEADLQVFDHIRIDKFKCSPSYDKVGAITYDHFAKYISQKQVYPIPVKLDNYSFRRFIIFDLRRKLYLMELIKDGAKCIGQRYETNNINEALVFEAGTTIKLENNRDFLIIPLELERWDFKTFNKFQITLSGKKSIIGISEVGLIDFTRVLHSCIFSTESETPTILNVSKYEEDKTEKVKGDFNIPESKKEQYTGGSSDYYKLTVKNPTNGGDSYQAECNDIIESLGMNFAEGNILKAVWRRAAARTQAIKKKGYDNGVYDAEKIVFFGQRLIEQSKKND